MTQRELIAKLQEYQALKAMLSDLSDAAQAIEEQIKALMSDREELRAGEYTVTWRRYQSSRFDTTAFKAAQPRLYNRFLKTVPGSRFSVSK